MRPGATGHSRVGAGVAVLAALALFCVLVFPIAAYADVPTSSLDATRVLVVPGSEVEVTGTVTLSSQTVAALASAIGETTSGTQSVSVVGTMPVSVQDVGGMTTDALRAVVSILALVGGWTVGRFAYR